MVAAQEWVEQYRIKISNQAGGSIEVSSDQGKSWDTLGQVTYPINKANESGFTASRWIASGEVAASAVNAIHIKVDNAQTIFSILPREFLKIPANYNSYLSPDSSIYTDIPAGKGIFGGGWAPFVGNQVYIFDQPLGRSPAVNDILTIIVTRPAPWPQYITFENRFGGAITIKYPGEEEQVIGEVLRPVQGVGRFAGSRFVNPGRIRANHPGVIDISTSVGNKVGGFQIIPMSHAESPEMGGARTATQWMVVGPSSVEGKSPEGTSPLFKYFLKPQYDEADLYVEDWENRLLKRFLVEVKIKGVEGWRPMPIYTLSADEDLPAEANRALEKITHLRILFPVL
jgi:hypothetical protein